MRAPLLVLTKEDLEAAVKELSRHDAFVVDVETTLEGPLNNTVTWVGLGVHGAPFLIPLHHRVGLMLEPERTEMRLPPEEQRAILKSGKVSQARKHYKVPAVYDEPPPQLPPSLVFELLHPLFFSERGKIGHNVKFDLMSMAKYFRALPPGPYHDTIVATHLLDEDRLVYDLKTTILDWFGVGKVWVDGKWINNKHVRDRFYPNLGKQGVEYQPLDQAARYLAKDVHWTWLLWVQRMAALKRDGLLDAYQLEMDLYPVLMDMETTGFPIDVSMMRNAGIELERQIEGIEHAVWKMAGQQFPLSNTGMRRDMLFKPKKEGGQGLKPLTKTKKTGVPQLNKAVLEFYADRNDMARFFLEWSKADKLKGTFIDGLTEWLIDGRLHTSFKQHGTKTGRLSSADPNIQQIPRKSGIRNMFVAPEGYTLVVADYDQIELRCAAFLSQDPTMMQVFREGQDIHRAAAASMYRKPVEEVTDDERQTGKTQNFSTLYGGGAAKLAQVAGVPIEVARSFIIRYYRQFAGLSAWKRTILADAIARSNSNNLRRYPPYVVIPPYGRRRRLLHLVSPNEFDRARAERQAVNAVVQGFASSIMKMALIDLQPEFQYLNASMLATVHDEVIVGVPDANVTKGLSLVSSVMSAIKDPNGGPILGDVPLVASAACGSSWADAKGSSK